MISIYEKVTSNQVDGEMFKFKYSRQTVSLLYYNFSIGGKFFI